MAFRYADSGPIHDPELGLDYALIVHGEQSFVAHRPVRAGDLLDVVSTVTEIRNVGRNELVVVTTEVSAGSEPVATVVQMVISRGTAARKED